MRYFYRYPREARHPGKRKGEDKVTVILSRAGAYMSGKREFGLGLELELEAERLSGYNIDIGRFDSRGRGTRALS